MPVHPLKNDLGNFDLEAFSTQSIVRLLTSRCAVAGNCLGLGAESPCISMQALLPKSRGKLLKSVVSGASLGSANDFNWLKLRT
jgi:hypothetical protein